MKISVKLLSISITLLVCALLTGCMQWDYGREDTTFELAPEGLFILNEGNFQYGNATLSFYNPNNNSVEDEVFLRANGMKLGDVGQSLTRFDNKLWIVVNNSHVIFGIDMSTAREIARIESLASPRYIYFLSNDKAYVTQLWSNTIVVVNPRTGQHTGTIVVPDMSATSGSTEQMVGLGNYVYCNCWSYQNSIIKIDTRIDEVVDRLEVGIQPSSIVADANHKLWVITDGGYQGSIYGYEQPRLVKIDPEKFAIEQSWTFTTGDSPRDLQLDPSGTTLYWINDDVWAMNINSTTLPSRPIVASRGTIYYSMTVSPDNEIYIADAIDYQQKGRIYRYDSSGQLLGSFYAGVTPGAFCWKQ